MASKAELVNRALIKLGQPRISNIETDTSAAAITMNAIYDTVRDATLQMYPWNFAIKRADLAPDSSSPSWGYTTAFPVPSDFLQLLEIKDDVEYSIESGKILCDESSVIYIKYIARITDAAMFPPVFYEVFINNLAIEACDRITDDVGLKQTLISLGKQLEEKALATDAVENWPVDTVVDDWITVRL